MNKKRVSIFVLVILTVAVEGHAQDDRFRGVTEYQIKAAFLYKFAKFVEWPNDVAPDSTQPFILGVLGKDPFGRVLDRTVADETVKGRRIVVRRFKTPEDLSFCHILFISSSEKKRLSEIIARLKHSSILTVGEMNGFIQAGGMIALFTRDNKVRFAINVEAAEQANLRLSSRLLRLARIVSANNH